MAPRWRPTLQPAGVRTGGRWKRTRLRRAPRQRPTGVEDVVRAHIYELAWSASTVAAIAK